MSIESIELRARAIQYGSALDEAAFFEWLHKLPCASEFEGRGDTLYIRIASSKVDKTALRELLALFTRYGVDMRQLAVFEKPQFSRWFRDEGKYWHKSVFKRRATNAKSPRPT
jgi:hypothetical protein